MVPPTRVCASGRSPGGRREEERREGGRREGGGREEERKEEREKGGRERGRKGDVRTQNNRLAVAVVALSAQCFRFS